MKPQALRVALVSREYPPYYGGGIGTYARWIVPALANAGVRVHVITEAHDQTEPRVSVGGLTTVHRVPMGHSRGGWERAAACFSIEAGRKVAELWQTGQVDVVEFAECEASGLASQLCNLRRPIPTMAQLHTPSEHLYILRSFCGRAMTPAMAAYFLAERMSIRLADRVLAPSAFIAQWAQAHFGLPDCPDVIPYATGPLPPPPPPDQGRGLNVFYAGRIEPRKGVEPLLRAWASVLKRHPEAKLILAGEDTAGAPDGGSMRAYLSEQLDERSHKSVLFLGRISSEALAKECKQASLCVIPSLWENFPNTCIESMASARPVLVSDQGGMREMIGHSQGGETFRSGDEQDLAAKMTALLSEGADALAQRGRAAYEQIKRLCDPKKIAMLRIEHYQDVIQEARQARQSKDGRPGSSPPSTTQAMRRIWLEMEQALSGQIPSIGLPVLAPAIDRWVKNRQQPTPQHLAHAAGTNDVPQHRDSSSGDPPSCGYLRVVVEGDGRSQACDLALSLDGPWAGVVGRWPTPGLSRIDQLDALLCREGIQRVTLHGCPSACLLPLVWMRSIWFLKRVPELVIHWDSVCPPSDSLTQQAAGALACVLCDRVECGNKDMATKAWGITHAPEDRTRCNPLDLLKQIAYYWGVDSHQILTASTWNEAMRSALMRCYDNGLHRIAIYGAGTHTRALGAALLDPPVEVVGLVDDDRRRHGKRLWGFEIISCEQALGFGLDAVVISANSIEDKLWEQAECFRKQGIAVMRLYGQ